MLEQLLEDYIVIVWKLDRLSRSLKKFLNIIDLINSVGAGFNLKKSLFQELEIFYR